MIQDKQPSLITSKQFGEATTLAFVTACVPVLRESYKCLYDPGDNYKPRYTKVSESQLEEDMIFGIVTAEDMGFIPPTTMCRQVDGQESLHTVDSIFFE